MIKFLKNLINKIEKENSKSFGAGRLDCCDLNKSNNSKRKTVNMNK
jgi:hypothetical protein